MNNYLRTLLLWTGILLVSLCITPGLKHVMRGGAFGMPGTESDTVRKALESGFNKALAYPLLVVVEVQEPYLLASGKVRDALQEIKEVLSEDPKIKNIFWAPLLGATPLDPENSRVTFALVELDVSSNFEAELMTPRVRQLLREAQEASLDQGEPRLPSFLKVYVSGGLASHYDLNQNASSDLTHAERIALPITFLILLFVFRTPLAAALPIIIALVSVTATMAIMTLLGRYMFVTIYVQNVATMIGLGVGIDYALLWLARYREEMNLGAKSRVALFRAMEKAGRTIMFSGATVIVGFSTLFMVRMELFVSIALAGILVVLISVWATLSLLPALVRLVGPWLQRFPIFKRDPGEKRQLEIFWLATTHMIMRKPWFFLTLALAVIGVVSTPLAHLEFQSITPSQLPRHLEARQGYEALCKSYEPGWFTPTLILLDRNGGDITAFRKAEEDAISGLLKDAEVAEARGLSTLWRSIPSNAQGQDFVNLTAELDKHNLIVSNDPDHSRSLMFVATRDDPQSYQSRAWIKNLSQRIKSEFFAGLPTRVMTGGFLAEVMDVDAVLQRSLLMVIGTSFLINFLIMMVGYRSITIPIQMLLINLLAVVASFGFLVFIFEQGGGVPFGFPRTDGLNSIVCMLLYCALFGISMDYQVFLLSRVREEYRIHNNTEKSVGLALAHAGKVITSAAAIMISIFLGFAFTQAVETRQFGLGMAFAIFLDAALICTIVIPTTMHLLNEWNWWWPFKKKSPLLSQMSVNQPTTFRKL